MAQARPPGPLFCNDKTRTRGIGVDGTVVTMLVTAIGALTSGIIYLYLRGNATRDDYDQKLSEQRVDYDQKIAEMRLEHDRKTEIMFNRINAVQEAERDCQRRMMWYEGEVARLQAVVESGKEEEDDVTAVIIVDGQTGLVEEWPPAATQLTHFSQKEMLKKPVTVLVPDRWKPVHEAAWLKWQMEKRSPVRGPINVYIKTKDGHTEVPVSIRLASWRIGDRNFLSASIRRRTVDPGAEDDLIVPGRGEKPLADR